MDEHLINESTDRSELARSLAMLDKSMEDVRAGRTRPAKEAILQIAEELGLTLCRAVDRGPGPTE